MPGEALIGLSEASGSASAGADTAFRERRGEPRTPTNWIAMIRLTDGTEIPCTVKDVSKSGARLGLPDTVALPENFRLRVLGYAFLFDVRLVWRSVHCAGVRIERFGKQLPPLIPEQPQAPSEPAESYRSLGRRKSRFSPF